MARIPGGQPAAITISFKIILSSFYTQMIHLEKVQALIISDVLLSSYFYTQIFSYGNIVINSQIIVVPLFVTISFKSMSPL